MPPIYYSKKGMELAIRRVKDIESLLKDKQSQARDAFDNGGDGWHDNFSYENIRNQINALSGELRRAYGEIAHNVLVVEYPREGIERVCLGCEVDLVQDGEKHTYAILGHGESDPDKGNLAYDAPFAQALLNLKPGDRVLKKFGPLERAIEILAVRPLPQDA